MMTSFDAFTADTESNLALGYVMAAQLHVRLKTTSNLTLASQMIDAALGECDVHRYDTSHTLQLSFACDCCARVKTLLVLMHFIAS